MDARGTPRPCRQLLAAAQHRGAVISTAVATTSCDAGVFVDATGRAARWSRPVRRARPAVATLFAGSGREHPEPGVVAQTPDGWVYRLGDRTVTTVGVVTDRGVSVLGERIAASIGIADPAVFRRVGIRSSAVQWSLRPIRRRQIAIGDAALAVNPIAGQGIRFALNSAIAAAAVIRTWLAGDRAPYVFDYYHHFVDSARRRHLTALRPMLDEDAAIDGADDVVFLDPHCRLSFTGAGVRTGLNRHGRIVADEAFRLADGGLVRYFGGVDLQWLRDGAGTAAALTEVCATVRARDVPKQRALTVIAWVLKRGVLTRCSSVEVESFPQGANGFAQSSCDLRKRDGKGH